MPTRQRRQRKSRRRGNGYAITKQPQIVSDSQIVTLRYSDYVTLDAVTGTRAYDTWSATSCFDPYVGAGGHQPLGYDEWSTFYNHYMVLGSKITAHFMVKGTATIDSGVGVVKLSDTSTWTPTNIGTLIEQNKSNYGFLTAGNGSQSLTTVRGYYSPKKFFGLKNPRDEHDLRGISGNAGTSPAENAYFHVGFAGMDGATDPAPMIVRVIIEYRVLFTERKDLAAS